MSKLPPLPNYPEIPSLEMRGAWNAWARAYGRACWEAAIEAAAEEAESFRSNDKAVNLTAREIMTGEVADDIASAIRSMKEPQ